MEGFRVVETGEGIGADIMRALAACGKETMRHRNEDYPALLVVSQGAIRKKRKLPDRCGVLLVPGDAGRAIRTIRAASAVSYGASNRDSLTVSSREQTRIMAAIQRSLVTVDGDTVECQEFALELAPGRDEMSALAVVGALILLGISPEEAARAMEQGERNEK